MLMSLRSGTHSYSTPNRRASLLFVKPLAERKLVVFRVVWNLLCGIPFLLPSFIYYSHLDHHRRKLFGTEQDGEYLPLANMSPWWIVVYLSQCFWAPLLAVIRFSLVTPLIWLSPTLRRWIHQRASSLVMDPTYLRPVPTAAALHLIRLCCLKHSSAHLFSARPWSAHEVVAPLLPIREHGRSVD